MIILIFGEDTFQSQRRMAELKDKFKQKYGEINLSYFEVAKNEEIKFSQINSAIESAPFLGEKRLVVITNLMLMGGEKLKEAMAKRLKNIPESSVVIFYERGTPKKNGKLFKAVKGLAKSEEFLNLKGASLVNWIKKEVQKEGASIESQAAERLAYLSGGEMWKIAGEIAKLINFAYPREIKREDVEQLVSGNLEAKIFDLVDNLAQRDGRSALISLHRLLSSGEKKERLMAMVVYGFRNLILVKYLLEKNKSEAEIKNILHLHPFVIKKTLSSAGLFSFLELKSIYQRLVKTSGAMRDSNSDPILALDLLLCEICVR